MIRSSSAIGTAKHLFGVAALSLLLFAGCDDIVTPKTSVSANAPIRSSSDLLTALEEAYSSRDYERFQSLFPTPDDGLDFVFVREDGTSWDLTEFLRIHRRLFDPQDVPPGETPVPAELWLAGLVLDLAPMSKFRERVELYQPLGPLDPAHWRATGVICRTQLLVLTQGETDYTVDGRADFVILQDLRSLGPHSRFLFYRIEELADPSKSDRIAVEPAKWSAVLGLYR